MNLWEIEFWKFLRGDLSAEKFETWLYEDSTLESLLGPEKFLEIISTNFKNHDDIHSLKSMIRSDLEKSMDSSCTCIQQSDLTVIKMSPEGCKFQESLDIKIMRDQPYWWLALMKCEKCQEPWLFSQESRVHDNLIFKRLQPEELDLIVNNNKWPQDFERYETLLEIGVKKGMACRYTEPLDSSEIRFTIDDLLIENAELNVNKVSKLFSLDMQSAEVMLSRAKGIRGKLSRLKERFRRFRS